MCSVQSNTINKEVFNKSGSIFVVFHVEVFLVSNIFQYNCIVYVSVTVAKSFEISHNDKLHMSVPCSND